MKKSIYIIYGPHHESFIHEVIQKIEEIMKENSLKSSEIVLIIEGVCDYERHKNIPSLKVLEKEMQEEIMEVEGYIDKLKKKDPQILRIKEELKQFDQKLIEYSVSKKIPIEIEHLTPEIRQAYIKRKLLGPSMKLKVAMREDYSQGGLSKERDYLFEEENLIRDKEFVKKIKTLSKRYPDKTFIIVRGDFHRGLSKLLRDEGDLVEDRFYNPDFLPPGVRKDLYR